MNPWDQKSKRAWCIDTTRYLLLPSATTTATRMNGDPKGTFFSRSSALKDSSDLDLTSVQGSLKSLRTTWIIFPFPGRVTKVVLRRLLEAKTFSKALRSLGRTTPETLYTRW